MEVLETAKTFEEFELERYEEEIASTGRFKITINEYEYFLNTDKTLITEYGPEFPLYYKISDYGPYYSGITGFDFKACGKYTYFQNDILQDDSPDGRQMNVYNADDGTIDQVGRNIDIFIPPAQDVVLFTYSIYRYADKNYIYFADPSLKVKKKIRLNLPDNEAVAKKYGNSLNDLCVWITINKVEDNWIYYSYDLFVFEGPGVYLGNYRITLDGKKIEKTDAGKFYDIDTGEYE
jgi:hypothetical protein